MKSFFSNLVSLRDYYQKNFGKKIIYLIDKDENGIYIPLEYEKKSIYNKLICKIIYNSPFLVGSYLSKLYNFDYLFSIDNMINSSFLKDVNVCPIITKLSIEDNNMNGLKDDESRESIDLLNIISKYDNNIPLNIIFDFELSKITNSIGMKVFENTFLECEIKYDDIESIDYVNNMNKLANLINGPDLNNANINIKYFQDLKFINKKINLKDCILKSKIELV